MFHRLAFISIDIPLGVVNSVEFNKLCKSAASFVSSEDIFKVNDKFHISLSRCFRFSSLQYEEIILVELHKIIQKYNEFKIVFDISEENLFTLLNDNKTQKFVACQIIGGKFNILQLIEEIDKIMHAINESIFYSPAIPHISLGSALYLDSRNNIVGYESSKDSNDEEEKTKTVSALSFTAKGITLNVGNEKTFFSFNSTKICQRYIKDN